MPQAFEHVLPRSVQTFDVLELIVAAVTNLVLGKREGDGSSYQM